MLIESACVQRSAKGWHPAAAANGEIRHDGYRLIVRRDGPTVRLYSRTAYDWTVRLAAIAVAAERIKAKSFTIDGEAVVLGPDGLSRMTRRKGEMRVLLVPVVGEV
jgi:ATP-dependent DNA ligase